MYPDIFENENFFIRFRKNMRPHGYGGITDKMVLFVKLTVQN